MQKLPIDVLREHFNKHEDELDQSEIVKIKRSLAREFKDQLTIGLPTATDEKYLRLLSQQLRDKKVVVKLFLKHQLHAKLYLAFRHDTITPKIGYLGSSNLTLAGLAKQGELNVDITDQDASKKLEKWFNDRWKERWCLDITDDLADIIDESWASAKLLPPYYIYLKIAYHLSQDARAGLSAFSIPPVFEKELLPFQQVAVKMATNTLKKRGGVMIGDVVGLGKTITASAVAKIIEMEGYASTLIICPKNLVPMWQKYRDKYSLKAEILSVSKVLNQMPKGRHKLVIIDESHNLRNREGRRYQQIREYIRHNDSQILLLSATPYNKTYLDLANQFGLFINDDSDLGISPENYIRRLGGPQQFALSHADIPLRSIKAFEQSDIAEDWQELMRLYTVRRTRSFIKNKYGTIDPTNGRSYLTFSDGRRSYFPDRIPKAVQFPFDPTSATDQYARLYSADVVNVINQLNLPRYGLDNYKAAILPFPLKPDEERIVRNLSRAGRRLMGFSRTNLFKRLESSGQAFLLSLARHILRNAVFIHAIDNNLPLPIGKSIVNQLDGYLEDTDTDDAGNEYPVILYREDGYKQKAAEVYNLYASPQFIKKFNWIRPGVFKSNLRTHLVEDVRALLSILNRSSDWKAENDRKLNALCDLCIKTHPNEKILVFTQFADTAFYVAEELKKRGIKNLMDVTGQSDNPTELAHRFSPQSNERPEITCTSHELRILISSDVLSEGQNLQDAHIVVNFDLPWAIIRLIQRAGRVDRIGQKAEQILCYSFLPEDGIEQIINLRGRLRQRIQENAEVVGSDEVFFDGDPVALHDLYAERAGVLDDNEDDTEIDLASYAYQIWRDALEVNPKLNQIIPDLPNVVHSTKLLNSNRMDQTRSGAIVYTRTAQENDVLTYIDQEGNVLTQSQHRILRLAECEPNTPALPRPDNHYELVERSLEQAQAADASTAGTLGKKTGVRYRTYMQLDRYCQEYAGTLFINDALKRAVDDIYQYPLTEFARETINRQLRNGISDMDLVNLVVSLREEAKLCLTDDDGPVRKDPYIVCSMGLTQPS
ncbi:helicase-related protein [Nibrella viscosa]